jgi:hypothetical protein
MRGALGGSIDETDLYGVATLMSASSMSLCTADQAALPGCKPPVLYQRPSRRLDSSAQFQLESTTTIFHPPRLHTS